MNKINTIIKLSRKLLPNIKNSYLCCDKSFLLNCNKTIIDITRLKHSSYGMKSTKKTRLFNKFEKNEESSDDSVDNLDWENNREYDLLANDVMHVTKSVNCLQNVLVIQPYIKWGKNKLESKPDLQLEEAVSLVRSLPGWQTGYSLKVPLDSLNKKELFGTGKIEEIKELINSLQQKGNAITCVFISMGTISRIQKRNMETHFKLPIMDRYTIVIQILRLHATSAEAKLQVAMAEIPYIWGQMRDSDKLTDSQKQILRNREKKLKLELAKVRTHREILRNKRKQKMFPVVAVVGYTNAGKTSLIKALTNEESLQPKNQLFATLDVTAHAGYLPCKMKILYIDTVGFMLDIPTGLIECFVATLEDVMLADVIIHVQDVSNENLKEQANHVEKTLSQLFHNTNHENISSENIINVGNKCDLIVDQKEMPNLHLISSKSLNGINDLLIEIENKILKATKRIKMIIRVPNGGKEMAWLYKNASVTETLADERDSQFILIHTVISDITLQQFKNIFLK